MSKTFFYVIAVMILYMVLVLPSKFTSGTTTDKNTTDKKTDSKKSSGVPQEQATAGYMTGHTS